jgi:hypothetical protein
MQQFEKNDQFRFKQAFVSIFASFEASQILMDPSLLIETPKWMEGITSRRKIDCRRPIRRPSFSRGGDGDPKRV